MRRVVWVLGVALAMGSALAFADPPAPSASAKVSPQIVNSFPATLEAAHQLLANKVKPELRPKAAQLGSLLLEHMSSPAGQSSKPDDLARQLASELQNLGEGDSADLATLIQLALVEGGQAAMTKAAYLTAQIAGLRAVKSCNRD